MSSHNGVSCDSCLKTNFSNRRYKCLTCDNYDLCGLCYDTNCESQNHLNTHPMQCILTKTAYELFYTGESIPYRTIVSLTCPYCGIAGFIPHTLLIHCLDKHSIISSENKTNQIAVMCPICVINPLEGGHQSRFVSLADHIAREHDDLDTSFIQPRRLEDKKEDFDEDDDEGLPLYILAERLFLKEENRRQRLAQTMNRNDFHSILNGNLTTSQQRPISKQSTLRVPRTTTGSFRIPFDTAIGNTMLSDPYTAILFSQDPLFDFDVASSDSVAIRSFLFEPSSLATDIPSIESINNDHIIQKKSVLCNPRQKRLQQVTVIEPSSSNQQVPSHENLSENDCRSLLGKILTSDHDKHSEQNHSSFLQSLFFSSMNISLNKNPLS